MALIDGMFVLETNDKLQFYPISVLTKADIASVINTVRKRVLNYFIRRNFLEKKHDAIDMLDWKHNGG